MKTTKRQQEFRALELRLTEESEGLHTIYFKEHSVREHTQDKPAGRTLFVVNVPPYADEQGIANAFKKAGNVHKVLFAVKPSPTETKTTQKFIPDVQKPSFKVAYVVFEKVSFLDKALTLTELQPMNFDDHKVKLGVKQWIDEYNSLVLHPKALKEQIETFMKNHDEEIKQTEKREKQLEQEDDEGWVTVTKRGKVQSFARTEKVENKILNKEEKKTKRKELKNFYTFQIRESKMKNIVALRQKFEEDKKKIAQIKQSRRFKPF